MPYKFNATRRHKIPKARYAVKNWPDYEASWRQRGDLRIWIADDVADHWKVPGRRTPKGDPLYTDLASDTVLTLRLVFISRFVRPKGLSARSWLSWALICPCRITAPCPGEVEG